MSPHPLPTRLIPPTATGAFVQMETLTVKPSSGKMWRKQVPVTDPVLGAGDTAPDPRGPALQEEASQARGLCAVTGEA